jgi:hypothetical protein
MDHDPPGKKSDGEFRQFGSNQALMKLLRSAQFYTITDYRSCPSCAPTRETRGGSHLD